MVVQDPADRFIQSLEADDEADRFIRSLQERPPEPRPYTSMGTPAEPTTEFERGLPMFSGVGDIAKSGARGAIKGTSAALQGTHMAVSSLVEGKARRSPAFEPDAALGALGLEGEPESVLGQASEMTGSAAFPILMGAASGGAATAVTAAEFGAQGAAEGYYEARARGADHETAIDAALGHGGLSAVTALAMTPKVYGPLTRALGPLDAATRGGVGRSLVRAAAEGGATMTGFGAAQQALGAEINKYLEIATPEEQEGFLKNVFDALEEGGLPSFIAGAFMATVARVGQARRAGKGEVAPVERPAQEVAPAKAEPVAAQEAPGSTLPAEAPKVASEAQGPAGGKPRGPGVEPPAAPKPEIRTERTPGELWRQAMVDRLDPVVNRFTEVGAEATATPISKERLRRSKTGRRLETERDPLIEEVKGKLDEHKIFSDEADQFLRVRGAALRNARMAEINPDRSSESFGSGMSDAQAFAEMQAFKADPRYKGFVEIAKVYDRMNAGTRAEWLRSGDKARAEVEVMERAYSPEEAARRGLADPTEQYESYYTGFRTAPMEEDAAGIGMGAAVRGSPTKRALGRESISDSPLAFAIMDRQNAIIRSEKLTVQREIASFVDQVGNKDFAYTTSVPTSRRLNESTGVVENVADPTWPNWPNALPYKTPDGVTRAIVFNRKLSYIPRILRGETIADPIPYINEATNFYGRLLTQRSPLFPIFNPIKDVQTTSSAAFLKYGPKFAKDVSLGYARAYKDINKALLGHGDTKPDVKEYLDSGAVVRTMGYESFDATLADIGSALKGGGVKDLAKSTVKWVEHANDAAENATRLSAYRAARKMGRSIEEAALIAKEEVALNFERGGDLKPIFNSAFAFSGAGIQGADFVWQIAKKAKTDKRIALGLLGLVAAGAAHDTLNREISGDDDNGENRYDKIDESVKKRYWIFMHPNSDKYEKVPKFQGFSWFTDVGRHGSSYVGGAESAAEAGALAAVNLVDVFNPLGEGPVEQMVAPTVADPFIQHATDTSFTGGPLAPSTEPRFPGQETPRPSELSWKNTPEPYKALAKWLSENTQTDLSGEGAVEVRPDVIRHWLRAMGGVGTLADQFVATSGKEVNRTNIPFIGRFFGENHPSFTNRKFYENRQSITDAKARYDELRKEGRGKDALEWRAQNMGLFKNIQKLKLFERMLGRIDGDTPEADDRRRKLMARFNKAVKQ